MDGMLLLLVTDTLVNTLPSWVKLPAQSDADLQKVKFYSKAGFPNVIGCIDCTHVRIQAPTVNEHEYVNRKSQHSINVQVYPMYFMYCVTKKCQHTIHINIKPSHTDITMTNDCAYGIGL